MNLQKLGRLSPALILAAVLTAPVYAGPLLFNFALTGVDSGNLTITETAGVIGNITGTFDGSTISALLPPGLGTIGNPDNLFSTTAPFLDGQGVSFSLATLDTHGFGFVNLSWNSTFSAYYSEQSATSANTGGNSFGGDSLTAVPEPSSITFAGLALGIAFAARRKRSSAAAGR